VVVSRARPAGVSNAKSSVKQCFSGAASRHSSNAAGLRGGMPFAPVALSTDTGSFAALRMTAIVGELQYDSTRLGLDSG
jgi:hypothetical protein